jgi:hypothetical protein
MVWITKAFAIILRKPNSLVDFHTGGDAGDQAELPGPGSRAPPRPARPWPGVPRAARTDKIPRRSARRRQARQRSSSSGSPRPTRRSATATRGRRTSARCSPGARTKSKVYIISSHYCPSRAPP